VNSLTDTSRIYDLAATWSGQRHLVEDNVIEDFSAAVTQLLAALGEDRAEDWWTPITRPLRAIRWRLATVPLPINDPAMGVQDAADRLVPLLREARLTAPQMAADTGAVADRLEHLWAAAADPLGDAVRGLLELAEGADKALLLTGARHLDAVASAFPGIAVLTTAGLRRRRVDDVVAVGPASWFDRVVLQAPRARQFVFAYFAWLRDPDPDLDLLSHAGTPLRSAVSPAPPRTRSDPSPPQDAESWVPKIEWAAVTRAGRSGGGTGEPVEAQLFALASGQGIYLDARGGAQTFIAEVEDEITARLQLVRDLREGHYLVVRTEGDIDYIIPVADGLIGGDAAHLRSLQQFVKDRLGEIISDIGLTGASKRLQALGSARAADVQNVRRWASPRSIRTEDPADFRAICRLIGEEPRCEALWHAMERLHKAHLEAGQIVRYRLIEEIQRGDVEQVISNGWADFEAEEIEGEGTLRVVRIDGRAPELDRVPRSKLRQLFTFSEDLWLG
jgi:hypothetical protein